MPITLEDNLVCQVNTTFRKTWYWASRNSPDEPWVPINTQGFGAKMQIRDYPYGQIYWTGSSVDGSIDINNAGRFEVIIPRLITEKWRPVDWVFDLVVFDLLNTAIRLVEGRFVVVGGVTLGGLDLV